MVLNTVASQAIMHDFRFLRDMPGRRSRMLRDDEEDKDCVTLKT